MPILGPMSCSSVRSVISSRVRLRASLSSWISCDEEMEMPCFPGLEKLCQAVSSRPTQLLFLKSRRENHLSESVRCRSRLRWKSLSCLFS